MSLISDQETFYFIDDRWALTRNRSLTVAALLGAVSRRDGLADYADREVEPGEQYGGKDGH